MVDAVLRVPGVDVDRSKTGTQALEAHAFFVEWELPAQGEVTAASMATALPSAVVRRPLERGAAGGRAKREGAQ